MGSRADLVPLPVAKQIAEALEAAPEKGIIHRDLKAGNVKITPDGTVKVCDLGLAKPADAASKSDASFRPPQFGHGRFL